MAPMRFTITKQHLHHRGRRDHRGRGSAALPHDAATLWNGDGAIPEHLGIATSCWRRASVTPANPVVPMRFTRSQTAMEPQGAQGSQWRSSAALPHDAATLWNGDGAIPEHLGIATSCWRRAAVTPANPVVPMRFTRSQTAMEPQGGRTLDGRASTSVQHRVESPASKLPRSVGRQPRVSA